jgi:hypothetical protein
MVVPLARCAIVAAAGLQRRGVEAVDGVAVRRLEGQMDMA